MDVFETMVAPSIDFKSLDNNKITHEETMYLNVVSDVRGNSSTIIYHSNSCNVDEEHISDIRRSILVSIVSKRQLYLNQFMK